MGTYQPTCTPCLKDKITEKEKVMAKSTPMKYLSKNHSIYNGIPTISSHNNKIELVKLNKEMSRDKKEKALTEALIRQGWKLVEDK